MKMLLYKLRGGEGQMVAFAPSAITEVIGHTDPRITSIRTIGTSEAEILFVEASFGKVVSDINERLQNV